MKFVLVVLIWVGFVGGMWAYMSSTDTVVEASSGKKLKKAEGEFVLEVTSTFTAVKDAFALNIDEESKAKSLVIKINGKTAYEAEEAFKSPEPLQLVKPKGLIWGNNEIYIEASTPTGVDQRAQAVKLKFLVDGKTEVERTVWAEQGRKLIGTLKIKLEEQGADEHEQH